MSGVMPRDGAIRIQRSNRQARCAAHEAKIIDWLDEITANCPKKIAHNMNDQSAARNSRLALAGAPN